MSDAAHVKTLTIENQTNVPLTVSVPKVSILKPRHSYVHILPVMPLVINVHSDIGSAIVGASLAANQLKVHYFGNLKATYIDDLTLIIHEGDTSYEN